MGFWSNLYGSKKVADKPLQPEDLYKVEITVSQIKVTHPKRADEIIQWNEIQEIQLVNTDEGPFLPDVWMLLSGNGKGCSIPQGSKGWDDVYEIVSKYEGFNFENVIKSASCTDNQIFELWKK
jgi:hypothetical protein